MQNERRWDESIQAERAKRGAAVKEVKLTAALAAATAVSREMKLLL